MDKNLENRIQALEKWKEERTRQQIAFPLDEQSQIILGKYFMHIKQIIEYEILGASSHTILSLIGSQGNNNFEVGPQTIFPYSVNISSDTLSTNINFTDGQEVFLYTTPTGTFPAPFTINTAYYVVNSTGTTFQLSLTPGGVAIDITTQGGESQYITLSLS